MCLWHRFSQVSAECLFSEALPSCCFLVAATYSTPFFCSIFTHLIRSFSYEFGSYSVIDATWNFFKYNIPNASKDNYSFWKILKMQSSLHLNYSSSFSPLGSIIEKEMKCVYVNLRMCTVKMMNHDLLKKPFFINVFFLKKMLEDGPKYLGASLAVMWLGMMSVSPPGIPSSSETDPHGVP